MKTQQLELEFDITDSRREQARRARCRRLLASLGDKRIVAASDLTFSEAAHREAEERCQAANRRIRENPVQLQETKST